ncbi:molybdenum cofactor biosynthesis prote [Ascobolus immersus RN42]|uniref:GTP 3',8-cyclase n=1 Tax=Ascobolus immersus RN42 TaxID=1160509 RepID=A0A3N4HRJ9_ASCIM|nr:molybdenum cofactor biosynthesis prote [Ascobolus immersus RN42]
MRLPTTPFLPASSPSPSPSTSITPPPPSPSTTPPNAPPTSESSPTPTSSLNGKPLLPFSSFLTDTHSRQHTYLRISLTERCNLRCTYCMPSTGIPLSPPPALLTTPEILHLAHLFITQGVTKIRLTGGEPTVRKDIIPLMQELGKMRSLGLREICITSNGIALARKLPAMKEAGLTAVNLSLDTLVPGKFMVMTRRQGHERVLESLRVCEELGIKTKVNVVVMRGVNEDEICDFVEMTKGRNIEVRFIEYMPFDGNKWAKRKMLPYAEMVELIKAKYPTFAKLPEPTANETSKTFHVPGHVGKVGFITSMTHNFCGTCNRLRITSDGNIKVCLFDNKEVSLRDMLRGDGKEEVVKAIWEERKGDVLEEVVRRREEMDRELLEVIGVAVKGKKAKHAGMGNLENMKNRPMILIDDPSNPTKPNPLPHLTPTGEVHQIPISHKPPTTRTATALGRVHFSSPTTLSAIRTNTLKKGDVLAVARVAGIMMAKRTSELVPLCHGLNLTGCSVEIEVFEAWEGWATSAGREWTDCGGVRIKCVVGKVGGASGDWEDRGRGLERVK